jgi:hypothetical protein
MAGDPFARMQSRLFARLGKQAVLRGEDTVAILTDGVAVYGEFGVVTDYRTTAALPMAMKPHPEDLLTCNNRSFAVDNILDSDGYQTTVTLRENP